MLKFGLINWKSNIFSHFFSCEYRTWVPTAQGVSGTNFVSTPQWWNCGVEGDRKADGLEAYINKLLDSTSCYVHHIMII